MQMKSIPLQSLAVNRANDRHGELPDESMAIAWLLNHGPTHMRNLALDITRERQIYEAPLVHEDNAEYHVYDGNRRVACLKLMSDPKQAPSKDWQDFFKEQRDKWVGKFPTKVQCEVEPDRDRIDEILYRRHTGAQNGVGQSQWDAEAKSNFVRRTGKKTRVNVAEEIENKLKESGYIEASTKIPRSNLNRLLSAETFRNRVGISVYKNHVEITHDEEKTMDALARIAHDLVSKKITLDSIWNNTDKRKYLDMLEKEGLLPTAGDALNDHKSLKSSKPPPKPKPQTPTTPSQKPESRKTLIRSDIDYGIITQSHIQRHMDIWTELQHRLKFGNHDNAIAVLFRVLLELSVENYITRKNVTSTQKNDKISKKFSKVGEHMLQNGDIDKKYWTTIKKFEKIEPILSANTLNAYVHNPNFYPSDFHLKAMWDTLSPYVVVCLTA